MSKHLEKDVNQVRNRILDLGEMVAESIETASAMIQNYDLVLVNQTKKSQKFLYFSQLNNLIDLKLQVI